MEDIIVKPKNKKEFDLVANFLLKKNIHSVMTAKKAAVKKKAKEEFLNSLEGRLNEVKQHIEGKIKLKSWDELYKEL
jgi:hypothetical protein